MNKSIKIAGWGCATIVGGLLILLFVAGSIGPETAVYTGHQIPKRFMTTIRSLNLLEEDEQIRYFYSDALIDIKAGLYFVTDRNLVLYSDAWEEPRLIVPLDQIASLDVEYDESFFTDSMVYVSTHSGMELSFPVSSEKGLDRRFVEAIKEKMNVEQQGAMNADSNAVVGR